MRTTTRRGAGLVTKFSLLMIILVLLIIAGVAPTLMLQMSTQEQLALAEGLQKRVEILLESVALRATAPMRAGDYATVSSFPDEVSAMPGEARLIVISGPGDPERPARPAAEDPLDRDYLWAPSSSSRAATTFKPARQRVLDSRLEHATVEELFRDLNDDAAKNEELKDLLEQSKRLASEVNRLGDAANRRNATPADLEAHKAAKDQYEEVLAKGQRDVVEYVKEWSIHRGDSTPPFEPKKRLADTYLFTRPIVDFAEDGNFALGLVRLTVSSDVVEGQLNDAMRTMLKNMGPWALVAVAMGVVGAFILANIAITPIGRLVKAVSAIRDTEDKSKLQEKIPVGAQDEIGTLAETVNEMAAGLVAAAIAEKDMLVGRTIQKQFLPLEPGLSGEKGSTGGVQNEKIDLYAFYEGAATVSGDYFDWQKLDDRYYAIIKCDVSGHGSPAAFVMVEVATLFLRWCREWKSRLAALPGIGDPKAQELVRQDLLRLDTLAFTVNDMIEQRGFQEIFAACMVCVYDTTTGMTTMCPIGDNRIYYYDTSQGAMVTRTIPSGGPAAGQFKDEEVRKRGGYPRIQQELDAGDVLVLFTDGFDEARRLFRDAAGKVVTCDAPGLQVHNEHLGTHEFGWDYEEMTVSRILEVFNAFFNRRTYVLERHHLAVPEKLEFEFSGCSDSLEEAVLALVSVERVYRTFRDPETSPKNRISLELKVDQYLRKHFKQYDLYFQNSDSAPLSEDFISMGNMKEDEQRDDLTVFLLRRP